MKKSNTIKKLLLLTSVTICATYSMASVKSIGWGTKGVGTTPPSPQAAPAFMKLQVLGSNNGTAVTSTATQAADYTQIEGNPAIEADHQLSQVVALAMKFKANPSDKTKWEFAPGFLPLRYGQTQKSGNEAFPVSPWDNNGGETSVTPPKPRNYDLSPEQIYYEKVERVGVGIKNNCGNLVGGPDLGYCGITLSFPIDTITVGPFYGDYASVRFKNINAAGLERIVQYDVIVTFNAEIADRAETNAKINAIQGYNAGPWETAMRSFHVYCSMSAKPGSKDLVPCTKGRKMDKTIDDKRDPNIGTLAAPSYAQIPIEAKADPVTEIETLTASNFNVTLPNVPK